MTVQLPITRVTVHPDGATVTRSGVAVVEDGHVRVRHLPLLLEPPSLRVAVRDTMGDDIPGYTLEDSVIAYGANGIRKPVTWKDRPGLEAFKGKTVHLLFEVRGAILYSYRLYDG